MRISFTRCLRNLVIGTALSSAILAGSAAKAETVYMIQLGSFESESQAKEQWVKLKNRFPSLFGSVEYQPAEVKLPPDDFVYHRTQAGPIASREEADNICNDLLVAGFECYVVETALFDASSVSVAATEDAGKDEFKINERGSDDSSSVKAKAEATTKISGSTGANVNRDIAEAKRPATAVVDNNVGENQASRQRGLLEEADPSSDDIFSELEKSGVDIGKDIEVAASSSGGVVAIAKKGSDSIASSAKSSGKAAVAKVVEGASSVAGDTSDAVRNTSITDKTAKDSRVAEDEKADSVGHAAYRLPVPKYLLPGERSGDASAHTRIDGDDTTTVVEEDKKKVANAEISSISDSKGTSDGNSLADDAIMIGRLDDISKQGGGDEGSNVVLPWQEEEKGATLQKRADDAAQSAEKYSDDGRIDDGDREQALSQPVILSPQEIFTEGSPFQIGESKDHLLAKKRGAAGAAVTASPSFTKGQNDNNDGASPLSLSEGATSGKQSSPAARGDRKSMSTERDAPASATTSAVEATPLKVPPVDPLTGKPIDPQTAAEMSASAQVEVSEAVRVPLERGESDRYVAAPVGTPYYNMKTFPSRSVKRSSLWAEIGYFSSKNAALEYWPTLRSREPRLHQDGLRLRVIKPFKNKIHPIERVSLRIGPFRSVADIRRICVHTRIEKLRCSAIKDMGASIALGGRRERLTASQRKELRSRVRYGSEEILDNVSKNKYWVQLGTFSKATIAQNEWEMLRASYPDILKDASEHIASARYSSSRSIKYRLRAGPYLDSYRAVKLCRELKTRGESCIVVAGK